MKCDEFDERVHSLLDDRASVHGDQPLMEHADACPKCRGMLRTYGDLFGGLEGGEIPELSSDFTGRVVAQVCAEETQTVRPARYARQWFAVAAVAIAAGLLIALIPSLRNRLAPNDPNVPQMVEDNGEKHPETPAPDSTDGHAPDADGTQLAEDTIDGNPDSWPDDEQLPKKLLGRFASDSLDRLVPVDQIRGGLRPITSSLAVAIDALRNTIPIGRHNHAEEPTGHSPSAQYVAPQPISA